MTNTNDRRPRDWTYIAQFNKKDLPSLQAMIKQINETHDSSIIEDFNQRCEQKLANGNPSVSKSEDLMVNVGLQHCINLILGTVSTRWQYMAWDVGTDPGTIPAVTDTLLQNHSVSLPYNPIDMSGIQGWREAVGMRLYFGAIRAESQAAPGSFHGAVGEIGVVQTNATSGIILMNRSKFVKNRPTPSQTAALEQNTSVIIISCVVEFCPVT